MWERRDETQIETLRVWGTAQDDPSLRLRLGRALDTLDFSPPSLSPSAVFVVRHLDDPLPGVLDPGKTRVDKEWEQALRERMEAIHRCAVRPKQGWLPSECEAVLFADSAELLACLARDMAMGIAWRHWWWQAVIARWPGGLGTSKFIASVWGERIQAVPAAIGLIHDWGESECVLTALDNDDVRMLVAALIDSTGMPALSSWWRTVVLASPGHHAVSDEYDSPAVADSGRESSRMDTERGRLVGSPKFVSTSASRGVGSVARNQALRGSKNVVPEELASLLHLKIRREHRLLLALGLVFSRRPWKLRNPALYGILDALWDGPSESHPGQQLSTDESEPPQPPFPDTRDPQAKGVVATDRTESIERYEGETPVGHRFDEEGGAVSHRRRHRLQKTDSPRDLPLSVQVLASGNDVSGRSMETDRASEAKKDVAAPDSTEHVPSPMRRDAEIETAFGGVLYLVNLMTGLGLPGCFESDWELESRVGPWAVLEVSARALLDACGVEHGTDPLWTVLAALDDRDPGDSPAAMMPDRVDYRLPIDWLEQMPEEDRRFRWAAAGGRLRLWSVASYLLVDVECARHNARRQVDTELSRLGVAPIVSARIQRAAFREAPLGKPYAGFPSVVNRFLGFLMPYLWRRLSLALGVTEVQASEVIGDLLSCPARICLTSSHVDLVAGIDHISMAARRSGLDRDPGWLPKLGRVVQFHYE